MDDVTLGVAIALMKTMPDNAASSAAKAEAAAERVEAAMENLVVGTLPEFETYLGLT